jgi:threonylcarbamoyladenosine tRNA methylthiotransferase MtaB
VFSVTLQTLGCKLNQLESESLAGAFSRAGFSLLPWDEAGARVGAGADIFLVNTCTVTSKAEQKARRLIRKALKENPRSCVIVTGCYAQMEAASVAALDKGPGPTGRLFVVPGGLKSALLDLPAFLAGPGTAGLSLPELLAQWIHLPPSPEDRFRFSPEQFSFHSRAFLKIQDGCDKRCSYCRVSLARGPSVSLGADQALSRLRALEAAGYGEAVLTGVNIGQYRDGPRGLGGLLEYLLGGTSAIALRLSSIEPDGLTGELLQALGNPRVRPHFHLSVQSGSRRVLERMGRSYTPEAVEELAARLRSIKGDPFLACDIITGFPGEGAGDFEKTRDFCRRLDFAWIHPFPYSPRPGTGAYTFTGAVPAGTAVSRVEALLDLARQGRRNYVGRWTGKAVDALVEGDKPTDSGEAPAALPRRALSENYLRLHISPGPALPPRGSKIRCRISGPGALPERELSEKGIPAIPRFDAWAERIV